MASRCGGRRIASCTALNPPQETPVTPMRPLHQSCAASPASTSSRSSCSVVVYSSSSTPAEEPVPRRSSRTQAKPSAAMGA